jgi:hypothetical protein
MYSLVCYVLFERGVILCDICIFVLCLIALQLPPGKMPNNNHNNKLRSLSPRANYTDRATTTCRRS